MFYGWVRQWGSFLFVLLIIFVGWLVTNDVFRSQETAMKQSLIDLSINLTNSFHPEQIEHLSFTEKDESSVYYSRISDQLKSYSRLTGIEDIYTLRKRDGRFYFGPTSKGPEDDSYIVPGNEYSGRKEILNKVLTDRSMQFVGPDNKEFGRNVSCYVPLFNLEKNDVLMIVGISVPADEWNWHLHRVKLLPLALTFSLLIIVILGIRLSQQKKVRNKGIFSKENFRYWEGILVFIAGLIITLYLAKISQTESVRYQQAVFSHSAYSRGVTIARTMDMIRHSLSGMAKLFSVSEKVTRDEYADYVRQIVNYSFVNSAGWVRQIPNDGFSVEYKVPYSAEIMNYGPAALEEDTLRLTPVLETLYTGLISATNAYRINEHQYVELFLRTQNNKHRTNGFVFLSLDLDNLVESISEENSGVDKYYQIAFYQVDSDDMLKKGQNSFFRIFYQRENELSYEFLDFFFGKVYKIVVVPGPGFFDVYSNNAFFSAFIIGLLLTLVVSAFFMFMINRRYLLEKQIERYSFQLRESQERFMSLFSNMLEGVAFYEMLYDDAGNAINYRILEVNEAFLFLTGISGKNVVGTDAKTLFGKALYIEDFQKVVETKKPHIFQAYFEQSDRHFKISVAPWGTHGFATIFSDITKRVNAEMRLKKSEEKYRLLVENQSDLVVKVDKEGYFLYVSPSYCKLFGKPEEELLNKKFLPFVHPGDREKITEAMKKLTQPPYQVTVEQRAMTRDGWKWISWNGTAIVDEKTGEINEIIGVGRDVTEQKLAETALQESRELLAQQNEEYASLNEEYLSMNEELSSINEDLSAAIEKAEESEKLKTAFLQNMSHEIRTPLNAIIGFSEMLGMDYLTETDRKEFTSIIVNSGRQLLELVNDILTISAIETRQEKINIAPVNLNEVLSELYTIFKSRVKEKGLTLKVAKPMQDDFFLQTDELKLRQIFINLLGNAFKFTSEGEIEFGYDLENDGNIRFFVRDTGVGIPKAKQEKIFERFIQADNNVKSTYGGTGLGLAICKGHVEMMGGKIWLESTPGVGSVFYFSLPQFDETSMTRFVTKGHV
ncbi:ATP-binding protein [Anaerophaga thermohalophila]|uniref:sensor histidine kinase n=1 Tax=Anaerophaga thermohalophila TaxID=177400 RepID=UPI000237C6D7|nr:ATP-binding protein [Anaerophaga thermohalophila]